MEKKAITISFHLFIMYLLFIAFMYYGYLSCGIISDFHNGKDFFKIAHLVNIVYYLHDKIVYERHGKWYDGEGNYAQVCIDKWAMVTDNVIEAKCQITIRYRILIFRYATMVIIEG